MSGKCHCLRRRCLAVGVGGARASRPSVVLQRVLDLPADRALGDDVVSHGYLPQVAAALKSGEAGEASCVVHHGWSDGAPKLRADQVAQADHAESLSAQISGQLAAGASSRANIQRVDISEREITERQSSPKKDGSNIRV